MSEESSSSQPPPRDPRDHQIAELRSQLDEVAQQLLAARDAVIGAEAELSACKARTAEVEHHLHVRIVEVTELQKRITQLSEEAGSAADRSLPVPKRLSPLLARANRLH